MSALSRNKGAKFERAVAILLTKATGTTWRRRVRNHAGDSDVVPDAPGLAHLSIECKHANRLCLPEWWRQTIEQAQAGVPVLVYRQTRGDIKVMLDAAHVNPQTWPTAGQHTITLDWEAFARWLCDQVRPVLQPGSPASTDPDHVHG